MHQNSQMCLGGDHSSFLNYFLQFIRITQWLMGFEFPPPAVSSPLPPKPHPTTLSSYLKCQRLLPITPPHAKPEAQATQTEASPLRLLSVCFHTSLPSVSPPPLRSYCFCLRQGLLCFSSSWPWLHKLTPDPPSLILLPVQVPLFPVPLLCQAPIL